MITRLLSLYRANRAILVNAGSLVGTTAITSVLGFFYWWVAARMFTKDAVGLASASVSTMMLIVSIGVLGLGTLLIGELPKRRAGRGALILTSLLVAGGVSTLLGIGFALLAPLLSPALEALAANVANVALFSVGVGLSAIAQVLDQALVGLLRGTVQLWRNTIFALAKLLFLVVVGLWFASKSGLMIYATWVIGVLASLAALVRMILRHGGRRESYRPDLRLLSGMKGATLEHHFLNLALTIPGLALPLLVTALLSVSMTASFYVAWMIAALVSVGPTSLTMVLYAVGAGDVMALANKTRFTLKMSVVSWGLPYLILFFFAPLILSLFGSAYAEQADWALRLIGLSVLPQTVKSHYIAICRIHGRLRSAIQVGIVCALLELGLSALGATVHGLAGLGLGLTLAFTIEALFMGPTVYRTAFPLLSQRVALGGTGT